MALSTASSTFSVTGVRLAAGLVVDRVGGLVDRVVDLVAVTVEQTLDLVLDLVECAHGVSRVLDLRCV